MTCIVGIVDKEKDCVYIAGDSASSNGYEVNIRKDVKVFKNGDFIFGCTSSFRMIQLLRFSFKPPEIGDKDIYEYMCTDFINDIRECFKKGGFLQKEKDGDEKGGTFLVGYKNRLFEINNDFQVGENINGIHSVGCGSNYALGALCVLLKIEMPPAEKLIESLCASEFFSSSVKRPFIIEKT